MREDGDMTSTIALVLAAMKKAARQLRRPLSFKGE
jgi:hypothetical protein